MEIITANALAAGIVVFRTAAGAWSSRIDDAELLASRDVTATALAAAEADAALNLVVEPYAVAVTQNSGGIVPTRLRERIRVTGPTAGNSIQAPHREKAA